MVVFAITCCATAQGDEEIRVRLEGPTGKIISPVHFGVNAEFFRPDLYYGTLPADNPQSTRAAFLHAIEESGIKAIRFPAGNPAYYYLPEDAKATMELAHATGHWEYRENAVGSAGQVSLENLADLARQAGLRIIYELPVLFYLDVDRPRAAIRSTLSDTAGNYDRDRIDEGIKYGCRIVRRLRELGAPIAAWELGNEEFALCALEDYRRVCEAYVPAIRRLDLKTPIIAVGMGGWADALAEVKGIDAFNAHYPFGNWPGPPSEDHKGDPETFAGGDLRIERWLGVADEALARPRKWAVTETNVMHHEFWDAHAVIATHAHALTFARNWMTLLEHTACTMAVFHDLATPYFGMMRFDVGFDETGHRFGWLSSDDPPGRWTKTFPRQYVLSPTCAVNKMLSALAGSEVIATSMDPKDAPVRVIVARDKGGTVRVVAVNFRGDTATVRWGPILDRGAEGFAECAALTASSLAACLPEDYEVKPLTPARDNDEALIMMPAYSAVLIAAKWGAGCALRVGRPAGTLRLIRPLHPSRAGPRHGQQRALTSSRTIHVSSVFPRASRAVAWFVALALA